MRPGIEPRDAPAHDLHMQLSGAQVGVVHVGDFQFAPGRGPDVPRNVDDIGIIEIQPGNGVTGFGRARLFLDGAYPHGLVEFDYAVAFGIADVIAEDGRSFLAVARPDEQVLKAVAEKDVVAEDQADVAAPDGFLGQKEGLRDAFGPGLHHVFKGAAPLAAVAEEPFERGNVFRRGDDHDVPDAGQHEHRQGIVNHGLVVDGKELLADAERQGVQARPRPTRQKDAFPMCHAMPSAVKG